MGSTKGFTAPELFALDTAAFFAHRNSFAVDVYSAGITVLAFLFHTSHFLQFDYDNGTKWDEYQAIKKQIQRERIDKRLEACWSKVELQELRNLSLIELVHGCLDHNPNTRITVEQAIQLLQSYKQHVQ